VVALRPLGGYEKSMPLRPTTGLDFHGDPNLGLRRQAPFSAYLLEHPEFPRTLSVVLPWDERGLHRLAGYGDLTQAEARGLEHETRRSRVACPRTRASYLVPGVFRWKEVALRWPRLREWLCSEVAFASPATWPWDFVLEHIGEHISPLVWHLSFVDRRGQPRSATIPYKAPPAAARGLQALSAWAAGWPLEPQRHEADALAAVSWLAAQAQWYIYAYNPALEAINVWTEVYPPLVALGRKAELQRLPLACPRSDLKALPPEFRKPSGLARLPHRPFTLARTQRPDYTPWVPDGVHERDPSRWHIEYRGSWFRDPKNHRPLRPGGQTGGNP